MNWSDNPIIKGYIASNQFGDLLGMEFSIESPGHVVYKMKIEEKHLATPLAAHGGSITALMDATMGVCALSNVIRDARVVSTIELKISFTAPAKLGDTLIGTASLQKDGKRIMFIEGKIHNQNNELIAFATGTFNSYPAEKIGFK